MSDNYVCVKEHYDTLIIEGDDPCHDSKELQKYMERWTGDKFIELLDIDKDNVILEVGIGTGRIARKVLAQGCKKLVGMDISPLTLKRASENLVDYKNVKLIEGDIIEYIVTERYDTAYSVLTFMHIEDKKQALKSIINSLKMEGNIVLSIDSNQDDYIDYGNRKVHVFPSDINQIIGYLEELGCVTTEIIKLEDNNMEIATVIKAVKNNT